MITAIVSTPRSATNAGVAYVPPPPWNQFKGPWSSTATNVMNDVVTFAFCSWVLLVASSTGVAPPSTTPPASSAVWGLVTPGVDPTALNTATAAAATSAGNSASSASSAQTSASTATNEAGVATTQAGIATAAATTATTQAGVATAAATTATTEAGVATTAAASLTAALAQFNATYLGKHATDPTVDNNGNPLVAGAEYLNTSVTPNKLRLYTTASGWVDYDSAAETDVTNANLAASNAAASAATATTQATNAGTSAGAASTSASSAQTSATSASTSASTATTQAGNAATSATAAGASASSASTSASTATTQAGNAASSASAAANSASQAAASVASNKVIHVRQTVMCGPATSGAPSCLPASATGTSITAQGVSASVPLDVTAAQGFGPNGAINQFWSFSSCPTWSGLTLAQSVGSISATATVATVTTGAPHGLVAGSLVLVSSASQAALNGLQIVASVPSSTSFTIAGAFSAAAITGASYFVWNYLAVNAQTGATLVLLLPPIYQFGGTISTVSGQFTFDKQAMTGWLGNGSSAVATPIVVVGQAAAGTSGVTSSIAYYYNGFYESGWTVGLPSSSAVISMSHNLGVYPERVEMVVENISSEGGYSVGDRTFNLSAAIGGPSYYPARPFYNNYIVGVVGGANWQSINRVNGTQFVLTNANWREKFVVSRGW